MIWKEMKEIATRHTRHTRHGSNGYYVEIIKASEMFVAIMVHRRPRSHGGYPASQRPDRGRGAEGVGFTFPLQMCIL